MKNEELIDPIDYRAYPGKGFNEEMPFLNYRFLLLLGFIGITIMIHYTTEAVFLTFPRINLS